MLPITLDNLYITIIFIIVRVPRREACGQVRAHPALYIDGSN
jgi:hypothetical protein